MFERALLEDAHALVIGISAYVHVAQLPPAVSQGARELAAVLTDPDLGGYPPDQVCLLTDAQATREAILEELRILASLARAGSTVLVYFAGHGGLGGGGAWLLPVAAEAEGDALARTAIVGEELAAALAAIPAARLMVIFDCCHAGGLGGTLALPSFAGGLPEGYCQALSMGRGRVVLASARGEERSWLPDDGGLSVFTRHLLAALRGGASSQDGWVRAWDLFEYVQPRVTGDRRDQHPVFKADLEENFAVALYLGGCGDLRPVDDEHRYHAYVSYADREPDASWVWEALLPRLEAAGLDVAVSGDVEEPGIARVVGAQRGIEQARRTVLVLSDAYLEDEMTGFVDAMAQTIGLEEGVARLLPVRFDDFDTAKLPARLRMLVNLDLAHPHRGPRNFNRLVTALHTPLSRNGHRSS